MTIEQIKLFIKKSEYHTEYLPIVDVKSLEIVAYEANSRFILGKKRISSQLFFKELHANNKLFFYLEQKNKKLQIESFDKECKLFLHFDADIVKTDEQKLFWKDFLKSYENRVVIQITENSLNNKIDISEQKAFSKWLSKNGYVSALNNFAKEGSIFSLKSVQRAKYIKIDRKTIKKMRQNSEYKEFIKSFVKFCNASGKIVILSGVEKSKDIEIAREIDANLVQGYYFSNNAFLV